MTRERFVWLFCLLHWERFGNLAPSEACKAYDSIRAYMKGRGWT